MRSVLVTLSLLGVPSALTAQVDTPPSRVAEIEVERSRACVGTLAEMADLNARMQPLVIRGQRLSQLAEAIAFEDRTMVEPFDVSDPAEARVRDWFVTDAALAQRYVAQEDPGLLQERTAGRETIKVVVTDAMNAVQSEASDQLEANQELIQRAGPCDGAIFVRSAVQEACETGTGPICEQVVLPSSEVIGFRFVDAAESVWEIQELRPWTAPTPLQATPTGQLDGARTIGFARVGNVVVTVSFSPLFRDRTETSAEELASYQVVNDSLGLTFDHPNLAVAPALGLRAALPLPLATETRYIVHFGDPATPDVLWTGPAGTGVPLEAAIPLGAGHVIRLQAGEPITLTALGGTTGDEPEYSIQLSNVNQSQAILVLLNYMTTQLATDLANLIEPRGE